MGSRGAEGVERTAWASRRMNSSVFWRSRFWEILASLDWDVGFRKSWDSRRGFGVVSEGKGSEGKGSEGLGSLDVVGAGWGVKGRSILETCILETCILETCTLENFEKGVPGDVPIWGLTFSSLLILGILDVILSRALLLLLVVVVVVVVVVVLVLVLMSMLPSTLILAGILVVSSPCDFGDTNGVVFEAVDKYDSDNDPVGLNCICTVVGVCGGVSFESIGTFLAQYF